MFCNAFVTMTEHNDLDGHSDRQERPVPRLVRSARASIASVGHRVVRFGEQTAQALRHEAHDHLHGPTDRLLRTGVILALAVVLGAGPAVAEIVERPDAPAPRSATPIEAPTQVFETRLAEIDPAVLIPVLPPLEFPAVASSNEIERSTPPAPRSEEPPVTARFDHSAAEGVAADLLTVAATMLGTPYVYGGNTPRGFDCSGFTEWAFAQIGISLPHNSVAQWGVVERIDLADLRPGDLVFNWGRGNPGPDHVGIYVGDGMMIHSPGKGRAVRYDSIHWWTGATTRAGRIL